MWSLTPAILDAFLAYPEEFQAAILDASQLTLKKALVEPDSSLT
jgi:hypothetical protein